MSLISQQADIVFQALQAIVGFLIIEQALQFHFRRGFALFFLAWCMAPNDADARPPEHNFPSGNLHFTVI